MMSPIHYAVLLFCYQQNMFHKTYSKKINYMKNHGKVDVIVETEKHQITFGSKEIHH